MLSPQTNFFIAAHKSKISIKIITLKILYLSWFYFSQKATGYKFWENCFANIIMLKVTFSTQCHFVDKKITATRASIHNIHKENINHKILRLFCSNPAEVIHSLKHRKPTHLDFVQLMYLVVNIRRQRRRNMGKQAARTVADPIWPLSVHGHGLIVP